ncbi:DUF3592 domain-containing protein [Marinicella sediminis]|uniref:DUF3592 domain-containing protein n=1 Tax=Marinicella sediminis TaxID=1792834 RepID=A0ABV7JC70_9GAMM|nr:DUF3592 domain-containing protein [Marinicella sediminis]
MKTVSWVLAVLGLLLFAVGIWMLTTAMASNDWPTVEGKVVTPNVVGRLRQATNARHRSLEYIVEVTYRYQVKGRSYQAKRYSLGKGMTTADGFNDRAEAREWIKQSPYQPGEPVTVYVDPADPENTVLNAGIQGSTWVPVLLGLLFGLLAWLNHHVLMKQAANKPIQSVVFKI